MRLAIGNAVLIILAAISILTAILCKQIHWFLRIPILLVCWFLMLYSSHCLAHYIVGSLLGIKFSHYTFSKSMLSKSNLFISKIFSVKAFLTLRIKERGGGKAMFLMFISGPLASILSPFIIVAIVYSYDSLFSFVLLILSIANGIFSGYMSYKYGCIKKALDAI